MNRRRRADGSSTLTPRRSGAPQAGVPPRAFETNIERQIIMRHRINAPAPWRGETLQHRPDQWLYHLDDGEVAAVVRAATQAASAGLPLGAMTRDDYPLPHLSAALEDWRGRLDRGHGMVLVRGLPVREIGKEVATAAYWLIGLHLGEPTAQNSDGQTLVDIRDTGASPSDHNARRKVRRSKSDLFVGRSL